MLLSVVGVVSCYLVIVIVVAVVAVAVVTVCWIVFNC